MLDHWWKNIGGTSENTDGLKIYVYQHAMW